MDFDKKRRERESKQKNWFEKSWLVAIVLMAVSAVVLVFGFLYVKHLHKQIEKKERQEIENRANQNLEDTIILDDTTPPGRE